MTSLSHLKWYPQLLSTNTSLCLPIGICSACRTACLMFALLRVLLWYCFALVSLSFALVLLKHAMVANASGSGCLLYKLVCLKFNSLSKYHAEPPTLTRLGASADFLSIELKCTYK